MSERNGFDETQKQYLSGFTFGADVARAVRGLPVLSGSGGSDAAAAVKLSAAGASVREIAQPPAPDRLAWEAQHAVTAGGGSLSSEEQAKQAKNALDMWGELETRAESNEFPKGSDVFLTKFHGLFYVAPAQNSYMCRLRIPGGALQSWQIRGLAGLADEAAGGYVDVTTRANLQLREIPADRPIDVLYGIRELDLVSLGSGSDNVRNVTASPLSGFDPCELIETLPVAKRMHHYILNHRELYGLPRKFNIAFDGGGSVSALDDTNDIGFHAVRVPVDQETETLAAGVYFLLTLGGITGHGDFARSTGVLVTERETQGIAGAILRVYIKHGDRTDRKKARLKYLLDDWGFEKYLEAVEAEWGRPLRRVDSACLERPDKEDRQAHIGCHPQRQDGLWYVGVSLPVGRIQSEQMRALADLADCFGSGEVRLTVWQNLLIPNVAEADLPAVKQRLEQIGLGWQASSFQAGLVACTGSAGCKFAAADTKRNAMQIAEHLQSLFAIDQPINIHLTGCHHSCAQHYIGDIGLLACKVEQGDELVDGYHIHLGGGWGNRRGIARRLLDSVPFDEVPSLLEAIIGGYLHERNEKEGFASFALRKSDDELRALAAPVEA